jgi:LPS export ABC transporter protein LptC
LTARTFLTVAILGAAALGAWSWQQTLQVEKDRDEAASADVAGFYMRAASFVAPGPDGQPLYRLIASEMTHVVDSELIEMLDVRVEYSQETGAPWVVTAPRGKVRLDWETLRLDGGVTVMVHAQDREQPIVLVTPDVLLEAVAQRASTASEVRFTSGTDFLNAVGMSVDLKDGFVRLESGVNGRFTP